MLRPLYVRAMQGTQFCFPDKSGTKLVPGVGVEPTLPKEPDFESGASANSATRAHVRETRNGRDCVKGKPEIQENGMRLLPMPVLTDTVRNYSHEISPDPRAYKIQSDQPLPGIR